MSYRELRNFTEIMRSLGYSRPISVENFRTPNFELVADVLIWLGKKYDPHMPIVEEIDTEEDRIEFLTSVCTAFLAKARIKLNAKKLYAADGYAVKELLKVARVLYEAARLNVNDVEEHDEDTSPHTLLTSKLKDSKAIRQLASDITDTGAKLYDLLGTELQVKGVRDEALRFLDAISTNMDSTSEHKYLEKSIQEAIEAVKGNMASLAQQAKDASSDEAALTKKIAKKKTDIERHEKRLCSLQTVRPAFMDEYERLEKELEVQYAVYVERYRNLDYLEYELDLYHKQEKSAIKENDRSMQRMQKKLREEELRMLRGENDTMDFSMGDASKSRNPAQSSSEEGDLSSDALSSSEGDGSALSSGDEDGSVEGSNDSDFIDNDDGESGSESEGSQSLSGSDTSSASD